MENTQTNGSSVAIVAIIVVGLLIVGAGVLFYTGAFDSSGGTTSTTVIEAPAEQDKGLSLKFEDKDGVKTEISTN
ncbi:hypothetical protein [Halopseudomonas salina]|uniref:Archaeal Type IV pilin N-terminal domain-containing protein n=1 Tax=Halopseudomonas salina TaxID=1323744 RepID=A0ABQ1NSS6_9GAMM|nr:hypothetical protein [Halopseudomonas salina]GGC84339.1 hypothetical protein GCM10007418_00230 [Halopseudomonas salina]